MEAKREETEGRGRPQLRKMVFRALLVSYPHGVGNINPQLSFSIKFSFPIFTLKLSLPPDLQGSANPQTPGSEKKA